MNNIASRSEDANALVLLEPKQAVVKYKRQHFDEYATLYALAQRKAPGGS
jgi:hypothetical protein